MLTRMSCIVAGACLASACAATATEEAVKPSHITLLPEQSAAIDGATLRYERAADSRCPPGVRCIWAGELAYHFTLQAGGASEAFVLRAEQPRHVSPLRRGLAISLGKFEPPPVSAEGAAPAVHAVELEVRTE
jgi:hypothetical protein